MKKRTGNSIFARCFWVASVTMSVGGISISTPTTSEAAPPSVMQLLRPNSAAISDEQLTLQPEHGPWLIIAASFQGQDAKDRAVELAKDLRQNHKLPAYILPKTFDYTKPVVGSGFDRNGNPKKMRHADERVIDSYGVLIGEFTSLDSPDLKETLKKVKTIYPVSLQQNIPTDSNSNTESNNTKPSRSLFGRKTDETKQANSDTLAPMAFAFVTRNPMLPQDFFQPPKVDKFVKSLNQNATHSLLDAPGRYTVRIATFRGSDISLLQGQKAPSDESLGVALEAAAVQANQAASLLRRAGVEAYEFHDRNVSIVTVGNFDTLGTTDEQGNFIYSAAIQATMREFGGVKEYRNSQYGPVPVAKTILDIVDYRKFPELTKGTEREKLAKVKEYSIPLDTEAKAIAIPRPETTGLYSGSLLGRK